MTETVPPPEPASFRLETQIVAGDAAFLGHFPGAPAYPGVGQLELVRRAVAAASVTRPLELLGLERVKFRAPIGPGTKVEVRLFGVIEVGATLRFELHDCSRSNSDSLLASDGVLRVGPSGPRGHTTSTAFDAPATESLPRTADGRPLDVTSILPHRDRSLFLERPLHIELAPDTPGWLTGRVPRENFLVRHGRVPSLAAIEFACQAAAVIPEIRRPIGEPRRKLEGALASVRAVTFDTADFDVTDQVFARLTYDAKASFARVRGEIGVAAERARPHRIASVDLQMLVRGD